MRIESLIQLIGNNTGLQHLDASKCEIEKTGIKVLFDILGAQNSLRYLDFSDNNISVQHPNANASNIGNSGLMHLDLSNCNLCEREVDAVCLVIARCSHLEYVNLSSNKISNVAQQAATHIASMFESGKLHSVYLSDCHLWQFYKQ